MNREQAIDAGIKPETIDNNHYLDFCELVVREEFRRHVENDGVNGYRERAIDRLIVSREEFRTDMNIGYPLMKRFMFIRCPYCESDMRAVDGGGSNMHSQTNFKCPLCEARISITTPADHAITVMPPKEKKS